MVFDVPEEVTSPQSGSCSSGFLKDLLLVLFVLDWTPSTVQSGLGPDRKPAVPIPFFCQPCNTSSTSLDLKKRLSSWAVFLTFIYHKDMLCLLTCKWVLFPNSVQLFLKALLVSWKVSTTFSLMCQWVLAPLWSQRDQRFEPGDLWHEKLSVTETSNWARTKHLVILQTHRLSRAEFNMIRSHLYVTDTADQGQAGSMDYVMSIIHHQMTTPTSLPIDSVAFILFWCWTSNRQNGLCVQIIDRYGDQIFCFCAFVYFLFWLRYWPINQVSAVHVQTVVIISLKCGVKCWDLCGRCARSGPCCLACHVSAAVPCRLLMGYF